MRKVLYMGLSLLLLVSCKEKVMKAVYDGKNISEKASILRDKETKIASLKIDIEGDWLLYAGKTVESIDFSEPIIKGNQGGIYKLDVDTAYRSYFQLVTPEGKAILAERHLPMTGGYNFRDLGGLKNQEGRYVKWGTFFRSDDLSNLTDSDLKYLASTSVVSIVDFRSEEERRKAENRYPESVSKIYHVEVMPGNIGSVDIEKMHIDRAMTLMEEMNVMLVTDSVCIDKYKRFFNIVQDEFNSPLLYHCSAGKDRTGLATALLLSALGVEEETIMQDYLSSNIYLAGKYDALIAKYPVYKDLFSVRREFLGSALSEIKKDHGTIENFLRNVLQVDIEKLKERFLY
ncbi:tyrosine-protein phosphatase [Porphyromonadaceae bacterium OttesenSCG-928-L07]|nr:tyrosine-protein phosphatase [Porphyromonadaceae bacterium OttesenSCG-928-L07]MDL2251635.1 tyrosine-protein phosphatase [Odoribacter sp. OttesenSCG-928-J03]